MKRDQIRHIPSGYQLIAKDERYGFEVYGIESPSVIAICFAGKAIKPMWHYRFQDIVRRNARIDETLKNIIEVREYKDKQKKQRLEASASHDVKPGDVFRCSWGYDQTNIDYYQVLSVSGQMAVISEIGCESEETGFMQGESVPALDRFIGETRKVRIQRYSMDSEPYFRVNSFSNARRMTPVAKVGDKPVFNSSHWTAYA